jgi:hypothetical protein
MGINQRKLYGCIDDSKIVNFYFKNTCRLFNLVHVNQMSSESLSYQNSHNINDPVWKNIEFITKQTMCYFGNKNLLIKIHNLLPD